MSIIRMGTRHTGIDIEDWRSHIVRLCLSRLSNSRRARELNNAFMVDDLSISTPSSRMVTGLVRSRKMPTTKYCW